MADIVPVTPSASYTVWAEDFASSGVIQRVKIVLGTTDADGGNVGTTNQMPVSGTVAVSGAVQVSGAVSVSAMPAVSGTVTVNTIAAGFSVNALVTGPVSISAMPVVSVTGALISVVSTVLGTVAVNVVAGGAAPGTTAATQSAISAQVVWLAPTQTINATVNTIAAGFSVNALVTGPVSISAMPAVSISAVVPVTTAASVSVTGIPVWMNPTQGVNALVSGPVSISAMPAISISVSAVLGTIITQLGTQVVSVVPGLSVLATVTASAILGTIIAVSGVTAVSAISTIVTILGTQVVTVASMKFTTATPTVTETGPVFWLANTVTVTVTATVTGSLIISGVTPSTGAVPASAASVGIPVWPGILPVQPVMIVVTSTAIAQSAAIYLFTIWTGVIGAPAAAATTAFAIPAGHSLRVINMQGVINSSAVTGGTVNAILLAVGATGSLVSASVSTQLQVVKLQVLVSAGPVAASIVHGYGDVGAGTSIGVILVASTAAVLQQLAIMGFLF